MRYKCSNNECSYRIRNKKFWHFKGKSVDTPLNCPYCGKPIRRYKLAYKIGYNFEARIRDKTNSLLGLDKYNGVKRMPGSGAIQGMKGDLTNFPKPLDRLLASLKDVEATQRLCDWWGKAKKDAIEMAKEPAIIMTVEGDDLIVLDYWYLLKILGKGETK